MHTTLVKHKIHKKSDFAVIVTVQTTLVKHKIHKIELIMRYPISADQLGQAQNHENKVIFQ